MRPSTIQLPLVVLPLLGALACVAPAPLAPRGEASPEPPTELAATPRPETETERAAAPEPEAAPGPATVLSPAAGPVPDVGDALTRSLAYLQRDGAAWMRGESPYNASNGCISCHVVGFALWSHNAAAARGLTIEGAGIEPLAAEAIGFIGRPRVGRPVTWSQFLLGRADSVDAAQPDWRAMVDGTLASQEPDGHWRARGQFPTQRRPVEESDAVATMWSLLALETVEGSDSFAAAARDKALAWLAESADGVSSEWLAMRLLTTVGRGEPADDLRSRLLAEQRADGGWSWLLSSSPAGEADPSNAYSTGVALWALRRAGVPRSHPAVRAAADRLLATQRDDGTWQVPSRLISAKPGEAKDYIYEYWGTAWAVLGLSEMLAEPRAGYQELLEDGLERGFPAVALWVRRGGAEPWSGAAGLADLTTGEAATAGHAFHLASITKLFTAVAALRLADAGKLSLNARLTDLLAAEVIGALPHAAEITVGMLLDHTSGLYGTNNDPDYIRAWLGDEAPAAWSWRARDFVDLAARREPWGLPGEATRYGDLNYILLGLIVERVAGRPLAEHVRATLFEPLGMESAYYFSRLEPGAAPPSPTVRGYFRLSEELRPLIAEEKFPAAGEDLLDTTPAGERIDGAAAIVATAADLGRFGEAVFRGDLLSAESRHRLLAAADGLAGAPAGTERQAILHAYREPCGVLLTAQGDGPGGSHTLLAYHPESDTLVAALVNIFGLGGEAEFLLDEVVGRVLAEVR